MNDSTNNGTGVTDADARAEPDEGATIAEAAATLNTSERTLRRLLSLAQFAGRTVAKDRQTAKGCRRTTLLSPALVADLRAHLSSTQQAQKSGAEAPTPTTAETGAGSTASGGRNGGTPVRAPVNEGELPAVAYQAIIGRQEREIEYLREALRLSQENLSREQTLRALPAPSAASQEPETGRMTDDSRNGAEGPQMGTQTAKPRSWWPWRRTANREHENT